MILQTYISSNAIIILLYNFMYSLDNEYVHSCENQFYHFIDKTYLKAVF